MIGEVQHILHHQSEVIYTRKSSYDILIEHYEDYADFNRIATCALLANQISHSF